MDLDSENESSKKGDSYEDQEQVLKEDKKETTDLVKAFGFNSDSDILSEIVKETTNCFCVSLFSYLFKLLNYLYHK
jgi:hypothetical protein